MSNFNFKITNGNVMVKVESTECLKDSKLVICDSNLVFKIKLKLEEEQFSSDLLFQSPFFNRFKDELSLVSAYC